MTKEEKSRAVQARTVIFGDGMQNLRNRRKTQLGGWLLIGVAVLLTLIIIPKGGLIPDYHAPGDIASRDIKSPRDLLVEDIPLTRSKRDEAAAAVPQVYDFDPTAGTQALKRIERGLDLLQQRQVAENIPEEEFLLQLEADFGIPLTGEEYRPLLKLRLQKETAVLLKSLLTPIFETPVVANLQAFQEDQLQGLLVLDRNEGAELPAQRFERTIGLNEALALAKSQLQEVTGVTKAQRQTLLKLIQQQLRPNLTLDEEETEQRRLTAREQVAPVLFQVKKGEMVVREGERVTADQILKLRAIRESGMDNRNLQTAAGLLICTLLLIYVGFHFAYGNISKFRPDSRDLLFLAAVFLALFLLVKISIFIATALGNTFAYVDSSVYFYAVPFALGAMLVRIVLNSETAFLFAVCFAVLVGVLFGNSLLMVLYALVGSMVGAHGVRHCQQRTKLYRAGLWIGLANMALLLGIHFLSGRNFEIQLLWKLGFGFFGGLLSAVFVNGTIPLVESLFKYTTDIKLPGTGQHECADPAPADDRGSGDLSSFHPGRKPGRVGCRGDQRQSAAGQGCRLLSRYRKNQEAALFH